MGFRTYHVRVWDDGDISIFGNGYDYTTNAYRPTEGRKRWSMGCPRHDGDPLYHQLQTKSMDVANELRALDEIVGIMTRRRAGEDD